MFERGMLITHSAASPADEPSTGCALRKERERVSAERWIAEHLANVGAG